MTTSRLRGRLTLTFLRLCCVASVTTRLSILAGLTILTSRAPKTSSPAHGLRLWQRVQGYRSSFILCCRALQVEVAWGTPKPIRAHSSIGQSPRLITGLFLVRTQVGPPLISETIVSIQAIIPALKTLEVVDTRIVQLQTELEGE